jgi:aspartyl-tRNA(Asn)/glutamyl-tRNA(Gln) amidotransferase subunit A
MSTETVRPLSTSTLSPAPVLCRYSAEDLSALYRERKVSPVEVTQAVLAHIEIYEPTLNVFAHLGDADAALQAARQSEQRWHDGNPLSDLDGIPFTVKDLLFAKGWPTRRGSLATDPNQTWDEDSPAVARLREHGAILLGKTTTPEFGWKGVTDSPLTGITRNPWNTAHTPGGSSGGAAVSAAIGFGPLHISTDGGGSTRQPAAYSGVFGIKPSFGRIAGYPASHIGTLYHVGGTTRTVRDAALLLNTVARPDIRDFHALPGTGANWLEGLEQGIDGLRIAFSPDLGYATVDAEIAELVANAARVFTELGARVAQAHPATEDSASIRSILVEAAVARLFETLPEERRTLTEPGLQAIAERGRHITATAYIAAVQAREAFTRRLLQFFEQWDLLLTPTIANPAPLADNPDAARIASSPFLQAFNLSQQPAASIPVGFTKSGLPVGLQIVGPRHREDLVLRAARAFERLRPFAKIDALR